MKNVYYKNKVKSRSDLFTLLSEACEIEHGLACSYLYSAFSVKQSIDEGVTSEQLHFIKKWAAKIFFIASQEMLHLAQVWNLLSAIGGTPYYFRPNFPQTSKYYPFHLPLKLEPFSLEALKRFILYELPKDVADEKDFAKEAFGYYSEDDYTYKTVGELYQMIREGFETIDEKILFIGDKDFQVGSDVVDFREIVKVTDRTTALKAVDMITEQGEGTISERDNCHYTSFLEIDSEYKKFLKQDRSFLPARNILTNPITFLRGNYGAGFGEIIQNDITREVSDLFDDIYNLMLRALHHAFCSTDYEGKKEIAGFSISLMVRVIKPLGEFLTTLPAYNDDYFKKAGPTFCLTRHIPLASLTSLAKTILRERAKEIEIRLSNIQMAHFPKDTMLLNTILNFKDISI